jgi:dolichol-phosphate mannosyltransferase
VSPEIVIVIPVYNEADNVIPLAREVMTAMRQQPRSYQTVFVDDASTDDTWARIAAARSFDNQIRGLRHTVNCGQSAAVWTGIQATQAPIIATLDGDMQNDPADLPEMIALLEEVDFVSGMRTKRADHWLRKLSSRVARWARRTVLGVDFRDTGCGIRAYRRTALKGVFSFNGLHRFLPILVYGNGSTTREVAVNHRPRVAGVSKYGVWNRLGRGIFDLFAMAWYQRRRHKHVPYVELEPLEKPARMARALR